VKPSQVSERSLYQTFLLRLSIWLSLVAVAAVMVFLRTLRVQVVVLAVIGTQQAAKLLAAVAQPKHRSQLRLV
jgi:hypothetical protein